MSEPVVPSMIDTDCGPVEYATRGTGIPVLVLHGSPGGIDAAEAMSRFLDPDRFQTILISRPGYLRSELGERRSPDEQAALYAALLDKLGIEKVAVLAWSGGGPSAYRLAARHQQRVNSLVALACLTQRWAEPPLDMSSRLLQRTRIGSWAMRKLVEYQPQQVIEGVVSSESSLTGTEFDEHVEHIMSTEDKKRFVLDLALTASQIGPRKAGWDNDCAQFGAGDVQGLHDITAPTLIVQGSADTDVVPTHSVLAHEQIAGSELTTMDRGTHFAFYTHPESDAAQALAMDYLSRS